MGWIRMDVLVVVLIVVAAYSLYPVAFIVLSQDKPTSESVGNANASALGETPIEDGASLQFRNVTHESGFTYEYHAEYEGTQSMMSNAGVYASDVDGNGWTDVLAIGGERPVLFENHEGNFKRSYALPPLNRSFRAALFVDYDNDGQEDLLLLPMGGQPVFLNNNDGEFAKRDTGMNTTLNVPTGASAADYTGNGCIDLFVTQNGNWSDTRPEGLRNYSVDNDEDNGGQNLLFRGDCESFEDVTDRAGISGKRWSLASSFIDFTGDGQSDIHVANDFGYDTIYYNQGDGTFKKELLGERTNRNGMSSEVADLTGDGQMDVFVTNVYFPEILDEAVDSTMEIRAEGNNLLVTRDDGLEEVAGIYGVREGGWGWAAVAGDLTNDGRLDLFHTTRDINLEQYRRTMRDAEVDYLQSQFTYYDYPAVWRGTSQGFAPVDPRDSGFEVTNGRGVIQLDYNNDGWLDLIVADTGGTFSVYENVGTKGNAIQIDIRGTDSIPALDANVTVEHRDNMHTQIVDSKSDFLSQGSNIVHVGTGDQTHVDITVSWSNGTECKFEEVETGQQITVMPNCNRTTTAFEPDD